MKKILSFILLTAMILTSLPSLLPVLAVQQEIEVKWNDGWAVISPHNPNGYPDDYAAASSYSSTDVFTVPKAGTKITWTDKSGFATNSVLTVSNWKEVDGKWVLDKNAPMFVGANGEANNIIETVKSSGVTYTYITNSDNEHLRLCAKGTGENIKVYSEATTAAASWKRALAIYPKEPPVPASIRTGAAQDVTVVENLEWNYGYVGSTSHSSKKNQISQGSDLYLYSEVFTVPKAGTTVYLYDDNSVDRSNGSYASSNAAIFSHWKKQGSAWVIDTSKPSIDGGVATRAQVGTYAQYSYTTTEDNENLRLCYRGALKDYSLSIKPYKVYLAAPANLDPVTETGKLTDAYFTDASGNRIDYSIYLPNGYKAGGTNKIVFNTSGDLEFTNTFIKEHKNSVIVTLKGDQNNAAKLIDATLIGYNFNQYYLYLYGPSASMPNAEKLFAGIVEGKGSYASLSEAAKALLANSPNYYSALEGITLYAMGDSYFGGSSLGKSVTWVNKLGNKYKMNYINYGIGGSTMSNYVTDKDPMVDRIKKMNRQSADIILLEGGRNDFSKEVPLGDPDSRDTKTFYGAVNYMVDFLLETYPDALIILVTPWKYSSKKANGYNNVTYANVIRDIAEKRNDPRLICLYAADPAITGVDMDNASFRSKYCITPSDVSHLNDDGMNFVLPNMEEFIAKAYMQYRGIPEVEETTEEITEAPTPETTVDPGTDNITTVPVTDAATNDPAAHATEPAEEKGCGGFISFSALSIIISGAYLVISKKKK